MIVILAGSESESDSDGDDMLGVESGSSSEDEDDRRMGMNAFASADDWEDRIQQDIATEGLPSLCHSYSHLNVLPTCTVLERIFPSCVLSMC